MSDFKSRKARLQKMDSLLITEENERMSEGKL